MKPQIALQAFSLLLPKLLFVLTATMLLNSIIDRTCINLLSINQAKCILAASLLRMLAHLYRALLFQFRTYANFHVFIHF
jgi:hypothetical protein